MNAMLNAEQLQAVHHVEGPILLIAGAGSGKTRTLTYRITHLLEVGVPASDILALTFTNKAAEEMRERIHKLAHVSILASTFHSLCARILRQSITPLGFSTQFTIFDEEDSEKVLQHLVKDKDLVKNMRSAISHAKNQLLTPSDLLKENATISSIYEQYQSKLLQYNALDFDDLLFQTIRLFKEYPKILEEYQKRWSFILIDEYQDTNHAQYMLIKLLAKHHHNVFAVGDPDQSIYSWRGANIENILNFSQDYPEAKIIALEQNYRSCEHILSAANGLISHNTKRYEKKLWSARGAGEKIKLRICESDREEATYILEELLKHHRQGIPFSECAIFYRTHFQSRLFEDVLLRRQIPYHIIGGVSFYMRREVKDLLAYLRVALEGRDFLAFARTINLPKRGIGQITIEKLKNASEDRTLDIFSLCQKVVNSQLPLSLSIKQLEALQDYVQLISALREMIESERPIRELLEEVMARTDFLKYLQEDADTYLERRENAQELISMAAEWEAERGSGNLSAFLEELSLRSSQDPSRSGDAVQLMTLHNGKGLEFRLCFLAGMEEELFPHINALDNAQAIEEERRLAYVGMTRARDFLYLSAARLRMLWGSIRPMRPSRFLFEIPTQHIECAEYVEQSIGVGDSVSHRDFGRGIVQKSYTTSLGKTYDIYFSEHGTTRSLVAKFAKLEKISP